MLCSLGNSSNAGNDTNNNANTNSSMEDDDSYPLPTIYRCRAPIASLDCMEEFNSGGGGGGVEGLGNCGPTAGTKEQLLTNCIAAQAHRLQHPSPGIRYRNLGKSGLRVSNVGLGTWTTFGVGRGGNEETAEAVIALAYDSGINVFDLSEAHSGHRAETQLGRILSRRAWNRTTYVVTTKIYWNTKTEGRGLSRKHIIESVQGSLLRLQLSYIDIVMIHKVDPMCPMEEIVRAMNYVISKGWVMYWGTSRWSPVEIMEAYTNCRQFNCVTPIVEQAEYHLFYREKPELYMPELYNKIGVGLMAWSTVTIGMVSTKSEDCGMSFLSRSSYKNKYSSFSWTEDETQSLYKESDKSMSKRNEFPQQEYGWKDKLADEETRKYSDKFREVSALAERMGCSFGQLAIAWSLKNESVQCLLLGAANTDQLYDSLQSLQLIPKLNASMMSEIERILDNKPSRPPMVSTLALR
ncbi:voltage-gated potassium channel subunit beta-2 isoform X2 [Neodiprion virginianus]|nr:voltage-gated potassium channel subunit beta-2 isoform X2 [Neodiprion fabricii]XP_046475747.1 voltage-gated potassium channel subunit beta-2 isoform X2 [Neodiprion pinetum]XP_046592172.1 voltage-gated potassium channel subunit beta-2 isoform X2 [Neodiprion lecontei]XP_046614635.1 voltage-gated potassium channel subunit beta-2 isoform X2 [Neodiprion virginianus]